MNKTFLVIPKEKIDAKESGFTFLFPLKGFNVGHSFEVDIESLEEESYILINRILDKKGIEKLEEILLENQNKIKGIVFEDLGGYHIIKKIPKKIETIYFSSHGMCSIDTLKASQKFFDTIVLSPDITKEEIESIDAKIDFPFGIYLYGPLPYLYSRRYLLTNFQRNQKLEEKKELNVLEKTTQKKFRFVENEFGTVCYDKNNFDGRVVLHLKNIQYCIINLENTEYQSIAKWMKDFLENKEIPSTTSGFLYQKTIYRLPPRKEKL